MIVSKTYWYYTMTVLTVVVWGVTFVSTKVLINSGLSPAEIMIYRFVLAYAGIWLVSPRIFFARNIKDEMLCVAAGLCAGSLYFIFENTALQITLASNVSLIICTAPLFTAFLNHLIYRQEKMKMHLIIGSLAALLGVALVVFNGSFILQISPLGDMLTILAALSWAFYGIVLRRLNGRYSTVFITRKVFFYGIITIFPFFAVTPQSFNPSLLADTVVIGNLMFLGIVASLLCYIMWNTAVKNLGVVQTSNYIYLTPLVTLFASAILIDEEITPIALIGSVFILFGVYVAERGFKFKKQRVLS